MSETGPAMLRVADVDGLPAALGRRLAEADATASERTAIAHDRGASTTVVRARDTAALEWLYDWLATFDGDERVERAASDVADAVEQELDARLVTDGGLRSNRSPVRALVWKPADSGYNGYFAFSKNGGRKTHIVDTTTFVKALENPHYNERQTNLGTVDTVCGHNVFGRMYPLDSGELYSQLCKDCQRMMEEREANDVE